MFRIKEMALAGGFMLCLGLMAGEAVCQAETLGYWRFEAGADPAQPEPSDHSVADTTTLQNTMVPRAEWHTPKPATDVPFAAVPQTGKANLGARRFDGDDDLATAAQGPLAQANLGPGGSNAWTVEASFKLERMDKDHWQGIVGRDGNPAPDIGDKENREPILVLKFRADPWDEKLANRIAIEILDNAGRKRSLRSKQPLEINKWYTVAATGSGTEMALWLKTEKDADYELQGKLELDGALYSQNFQPAAWSIGRGYFNGNIGDWTYGLIDEVRISNQVLEKSQFLATAKTGPLMNEHLAQDENFANELTAWATTEVDGSSVRWTRTPQGPVVVAQVNKVPGIAPWQVALKQWVHHELPAGQTLILIAKLRSPTKSKVNLYLENAERPAEKIIEGTGVQLEAEFKEYTFTGVVKSRLAPSAALINLHLGLDTGVVEVASIRLVAAGF